MTMFKCSKCIELDYSCPQCRKLTLAKLEQEIKAEATLMQRILIEIMKPLFKICFIFRYHL